MSLKVKIEYDHVPHEDGLVAGWWLAVIKDSANGHSEEVDFLPTKPTARQIRQHKKALKCSVKN